MKHLPLKLILFAALVSTVFLSGGCGVAQLNNSPPAQISATPQFYAPNYAKLPHLSGFTYSNESAAPDLPAPEQPEIPAVTPQNIYAEYIMVTATNVKIRAGAGTLYTALGTAEKSTLYISRGTTDGWYTTNYKGKTCYISSKYCKPVAINSSGDSRIESVIAQGCLLLGTKYVYGATRLHDGRGNFLSGFTAEQFDCSSLMQYIFYKGAGVLLNVNTRTQIYQGVAVNKSEIKRGDLMFFTNDSRRHNTGIERVGHVALYLGDGYILHTASDYAKIEKLTSARWNYYIQSRRII